MPNAHAIIEAMERIAPPRLACEGDPVGLQAGRRDRRVRRVLLALDVTEGTVTEAGRRKAEMLISHHPAFYKGLQRLDEEETKGALAAAIARAKLTVYAAHTNLDIAPGGVNDCLADAVGLGPDRRPLRPTGRDAFLKLTIYVPDSHLPVVRKAICDAGAGRWGEYADCTFRVEGTGAFRCGAATRPHIGAPGRYEETPEWRLESRLLSSDRPAIEAALLGAHPYETPAYDFAVLDDGVPCGLGRLGTLAEPLRLDALAERLAGTLKAPGVQVCGTARRTVRRAAVWSGAGAPVEQAARAGADALVCGECSYHDAETAAHHGLGIVRLGHGVSERLALPTLARRLRRALPKVTFLLSRDRAAPFRNVGPD